MCYFVKNVMKFLRELCLAQTEIWRFFIAIATVMGYVCHPLCMTRINSADTNLACYRHTTFSRASISSRLVAQLVTKRQMV